ncbi:nuclear transcription factor Y subunit A-1-like isoform X2 [Cornus florida]|uniref:nuclear transcription factor Y subunit A-1-like isoform X2 n=1 Tax=Cornus florida TaxID=4283 RepID=UPI002897E568|nr:nuclear transcription factor Y subunit A-1-like isoform X2 [Cornus florida]
MHQKSESTNLLDSNTNNSQQYTTGSQAWRCSIRRDAISANVLGEGTSYLSSPKHPNGGRQNPACALQDNGVKGKRYDTHRVMQTTILPNSDGNCGQESQHAVAIMPQTIGEYLTPPTQMELVGHSIVCGSYPSSNPYCGSVLPALGPQALVPSHLSGEHHSRMALPIELTEEPVYVNAKQYHGILRRRQSRAKAELEQKQVVRKPYRHESRHLHALRRARGTGGRFLKTNKVDSASGIASRSSSSFYFESAPSANADSSTAQEEVNELPVQNMHRVSTSNCNVNSCYSHNQASKCQRSIYF